MWQNPGIKVIKECDSLRTHEMENKFILLILHLKGNFTPVRPFSKHKGETEARSPKSKLKTLITNLFFLFLFPHLPSVRAHLDTHPVHCFTTLAWVRSHDLTHQGFLKELKSIPIITFPNRTGSGTPVQAHMKVQWIWTILETQLS